MLTFRKRYSILLTVPSDTETRNTKKQRNAIVVQLVVRHLAKVEVAGSSPVCRSFFISGADAPEIFLCNLIWSLHSF